MLKHDETFEINEVGAKIWELCSGELTEKEITEEIAQYYSIPYQEAEKDVREFLTDMRESGLIE